MNSTYSVSQAQSRLPRLLKDATRGDPIAITRHDRTVAFLVSRERMEAIVETLEILGNAEAMQAIRRHRQGRTLFFPLKALDD
ncbi:MAG: type II toxin-antitoxin system prevent-host-death family antitoxin [Lentisphaerae bacterium]|nr:type II toxin-antitoxin system prevent-host-death family antitoxin [Lentisphaerota bacterium]